jgi:hypothetical protein
VCIRGVLWCFGASIKSLVVVRHVSTQPGGVRYEGDAAQERSKQQVRTDCLCFQDVSVRAGKGRRGSSAGAVLLLQMHKPGGSLRWVRSTALNLVVWKGSSARAVLLLALLTQSLRRC